MKYDLPDVFVEPPAEETELALDCVRAFSQAQNQRYNFSTQWEETASLIWPAMRNTFMYGSFFWPGQKKTEYQVDASGMLALTRFAAICDSVVTPQNMLYQSLEGVDEQVRRDRQCRLWFEQATNILFRYRYLPQSGFAGQNHLSWLNLGAFGNRYVFVDDLEDNAGKPAGVRYKSVPVGEIFLTENHQGIVDGFIRYFRMTARQVLQKWGPAKFPVAYKPALESSDETIQFEILHWVRPRADFDPRRADVKGKPFASYYVALGPKRLMSEGGYRCFPLAVGRYLQTPGEVYGRGPAQLVLPALKTLNAEKQDFLKVGHRTADPILFTADDGLVDSTKLIPGVVNPGGVSADGKLLVQPLPLGNIQITQEMMAAERGDIDSMFLVDLFQILEKGPQMSATEVIERVNEKAILMAPTLGRQVEGLEVMTERELDILSAQHLLPPMPPLLKEYRGEYRTVSTSPLSKAAKAGEASGFMRTLEMMTQAANATQDPSLLDIFAFDRAGPAVAEIQSVPESWMSTPKERAAKAQARAQSQQVDQQIKMAPAKAAMVKANAIAAKAGAQNGQSPGGPPPGQSSFPMPGQDIGLQ